MTSGFAHSLVRVAHPTFTRPIKKARGGVGFALLATGIVILGIFLLTRVNKEEKKSENLPTVARRQDAPQPALRPRVRINDEANLEQTRRIKEDYVAKIRTKIESNTNILDDWIGPLHAEFTIVLLPTGELLSANLIKSSGNEAYDAAMERAIAKSAPLPLPPNNPALFREFRELRLPFTYENKPA